MSGDIHHLDHARGVERDEPVTTPLLANVEAEAGLLGALMHDPRLIDPVADRLEPSLFYEALHGRIFSAIVREHSQGRAPTPITLAPFFAADPAVQQLGGALSYLATISGSAAVVGARDFAEQIRSLAHRRRLAENLQTLLVQANDLDVSFEAVVGDAESAIAEAADDETTATSECTAAEAVTAHLTQIERGLPPGVTCGIAPIDQAIGPIRPGDLVILAGRPGMFKTGTALNYSRGVAEGGDAPLLNERDEQANAPQGVLFISLEMKKEQLGMRLVAELCFNGHSGINFGSIEQGTLTPEQFRTAYRARDRIADLPLEIVDMASARPSQLNRLIRRWKRRFAARGIKLVLVVLDYLQLMDAERSSDNRTNEVTQISRGLKMCAKANDVGMLALAQLSRKVEEREEKRPRLSDLRESGSIEQDADVVLFLYRQEYYLRQNEPPEGHERRDRWEAAIAACEGDIEFICAKRRQGQTGIRHGRFYGAFQAVRA